MTERPGLRLQSGHKTERWCLGLGRRSEPGCRFGLARRDIADCGALWLRLRLRRRCDPSRGLSLGPGKVSNGRLQRRAGAVPPWRRLRRWRRHSRSVPWRRLWQRWRGDPRRRLRLWAEPARRDIPLICRVELQRRLYARRALRWLWCGGAVLRDGDGPGRFGANWLRPGWLRP